MAAGSNRKWDETAKNTGFFCKKRLTGGGKCGIVGITCEWVLSFCALFRFGGAEGDHPAGRQKGVPERVKITLRCNECKQRNYNTMKNKKNTPDKLELNKYCPFCRKHTVHTETK